MLIENNIEISESNIHKVTNELSQYINESVSRYIALGYSVKFRREVDLGPELFAEVYTSSMSICNDFDLYYNSQLGVSQIRVLELSNLIKVNDIKQVVLFTNLVEVPVDIGLHFKMHMFYYLDYSEIEGRVDVHLVGIRFYADEINKKVLEDGEVYISLNLGDIFSSFGIYVISNTFKMLKNIIFLDIKSSYNTYRLCLCSTHKEVINNL